MSRTEEILRATIDGDEYAKTPQSREEELLIELKQTIEAGGGASVVPNPEGEATETLEKLGINDTVYGIPSGGGGSNVVLIELKSNNFFPDGIKQSDIYSLIESGKIVYIKDNSGRIFAQTNKEGKKYRFTCVYSNWVTNTLKFYIASSIIENNSSTNVGFSNTFTLNVS